MAAKNSASQAAPTPRLLHSPVWARRFLPVYGRLQASPQCFLQSLRTSKRGCQGQPCYDACGEDLQHACQTCVTCDPLPKVAVRHCRNGTAFPVPRASLPESHSPGTGREGRAGPYPSCNLLGKGFHQRLHAVVQEHGGVVEELLVVVLFPLDDEGVGHQPMPVIELVELHRDAIPVLELRPKQQLGVKLEAEEVPTEVLDVVFNDDLNGLPWAGGERSSRQLAAARATGSVPR